MEGHDRGRFRSEDRWQPARLPAAAISLVLMEWALADVMGSPVALLRALGGLRHSWADPVAALLALMALLAQALVAYGLVVLLLQSLCGLPGSMGRLAGRLMSLVTPATVRRLLDVLVGGALLAQVALATTPEPPPGHRWSGPRLASTACLSVVDGSLGPAILNGPSPTSHGPGQLRWPLDAMEPAGARPTPRRSAAPLPPWLGGGPSNAGPRHSIEAGDPSVPRHGSEAGDAAAPRAGEGMGGPTVPRQNNRAGGSAAPRHGNRAGDAAVSRHIVEVGDTLWDIAAARLAPAERSAANVHRYWQQIYRANRAVIGADPDLIHPGTRLDVPSFRRGRR
jgi:LysM domain